MEWAAISRLELVPRDLGILAISRARCVQLSSRWSRIATIDTIGSGEGLN